MVHNDTSIEMIPHSYNICKSKSSYIRKKKRSISFCQCRLNFLTAAKHFTHHGHPNMVTQTIPKLLIPSGVPAFEKTTALSGSSSVAQPEDCMLCEWLFPWFCGFVQLEQWPHCNPRLFTFQQISSYWNHGEGRAGVKEDSHAPYLCKTNTRLTWDTHLVNSPQGSNTWGWQWLINTSCDQSLVWSYFPMKASKSLLCPSLTPENSTSANKYVYFPSPLVSHELLSRRLERPPFKYPLFDRVERSATAYSLDSMPGG